VGKRDELTNIAAKKNTIDAHDLKIFED